MEARDYILEHRDALEPALAIDISADKQWIAYITEDKILKIKPLVTPVKAMTDEGMADKAPTPSSTMTVERDIEEWFASDEDYCYFLSVSSGGRRAAVSFLKMNKTSYEAYDRVNQNRKCFIFRRKEVGPNPGFEMEQALEFNGRAVFLKNGNLALVNESVLEVYDCDKSYKKIHWFDLRALTSTKTGTYNREGFDGSEPVINTPWANFKKCAAIIKKSFSAARNIIKISKLIRHNVITTPYSNIFRAWSLIEDGVRLTSFHSEDTEEILAFSDNYKYFSTSVKENNSIRVYTVKSGIVISRLVSALKDDIKTALVNEGKSSDYRINHAHFCQKGQYLVVISIEKLAQIEASGNNAIIIFEVWDIFAEKSIYQDIDYITVKWEEDMAQGDFKYMQPFVYENPVDTMALQPKFIAVYSTLNWNGACQLREKPIHIYNDKYTLEGDVDDTIISNKNWRIPSVPPFKNDVRTMPVYLEQTVGGFRYILRFGSQTVQLWKHSKADTTLNIEEDELIYIRAFKAPSYGFNDAFDENWIRKSTTTDATQEAATINTEATKQSIEKSIMFMENDSEGRVVVIIRSKDNSSLPVHAEEIYLPLNHLNDPSTDVMHNFRHEHHYFESACRALHHLWSYMQSSGNESSEAEMATVRTMFNKTLEIVNGSIRTMKLIRSKYFTTVSGSNTLAMLASMLETFPEGRSILFDIMKTDELQINLFSYVRIKKDEGRKNENALIVLIEFLEDDLFELMFNRVLLHSKKLGTGSFSAVTDAILFLQERGNGGLLLKSCQKLSYLQINTKILTVLSSEVNEEMKMLTLHKIMEPDFRDLETHSTKEQITKYTNHWFLGGWLSLLFYWWSIYITYGIKSKIDQWWYEKRKDKLVKRIIRFFMLNGGLVNKSLIKLCVVPLHHFNSYSDFPEDRHEDYNDLDDSTTSLEKWVLIAFGQKMIKLAQAMGILYKPKEEDPVIPYKTTSAFIRNATNQHESDIFHQGDTVFEVLLQYKWENFARRRFFLVYSIYLTYYIAYSVGVLYPREVFDYALGTPITDNRGHLACIILMFLSGGFLLIQEMHQFIKYHSKFAYLISPYNVLDILAFVLPVANFCQMVTNQAGIDELGSICTLTLWLHGILRLRVFSFIASVAGITLETIIQLIKSVYKVLFIMLLVIFAFTHAFMVLLSHKEDSFFQEQYEGSVNLTSSGDTFSGENEAAFHDTSANNNFNNPFKAFSMVWNFIWGVWDPINDGDAGDDYMVMVLAIMFSFLTVLLFINLVIALMSSKAEEVKKRGKRVWISHFAAVVAEIEQLWCTSYEQRCRKNNPTFIYYIAKVSDIKRQNDRLIEETNDLVRQIRAQRDAGNDKSSTDKLLDSMKKLSARIQEAENASKLDLMRQWSQVLSNIECIRD
ncbi:hypothetical protein V8B55DRAFT_1442683 [Mucor lusitanicus]